MSTPRNSPGYDTRSTRLVIHLYRQYELPVAYSAETTVLTGAMQSRLMLQIQEFQADFLSRIGQLRHNYSNCVRLIADSGEAANHRGIYRHPVGWYQANRPEIYERFKQLLLDIRNLLPSLPVSPLEGVDDAVAERIRRFEIEANAVIVQPVRDMALKVLTHTLVGEGLLTEQAMLVYFDLRDADFTRTGFSKVIARVIHGRQRLYFRKHVPDALLAGNINVLQGQLDGHCSHLMSLLTSRDLSTYVQSTLRAIRSRHLPVIMTQVLRDLTTLDAHRARVYAHAVSRRPVCLKDLILHAAGPGGSLLECAAAIESLTRPPTDATDSTVAEIARALDALHRFGPGIDDLPEEALDLKSEALRAGFVAGVDACLAFLTAYAGICDKVEAAVRPLLGLISFDSGGQSDFYARWFPGLHLLLERDRRLEEYSAGLRRLQSLWVQTPARESALREALDRRLTAEARARAETATPHVGRLAAADLVDLLAATGALLEYLTRVPAWFDGLEAEIFHAVDEKKAQAQRVIAAGRS